MKLIFTDAEMGNADDVVHFSLKLANECFGRIGNVEDIDNFVPAKTQNTFTHVLWTKPLRLPFQSARWHIACQYELSLALSALSLAVLKEHGQTVEIYTDTDGLDLIGCLPYDKGYNAFDGLGKQDGDTDFWACGKVYALMRSGDNAIIDNDLFLYDGRLIDALAGRSVVASHREETTNYKHIIEMGQHMFPHMAGGGEYSTNTGIMKVADEETRNKFISAYLAGRRAFQSANVREAAKAGGMCIDLLIEQFNFHKICNPHHLIAVEQNPELTKGLVHLLSVEKYLKIPMVLDMLRERYPDYYNAVIAKWDSIGFSVWVEDVRYEAL